MLDISNNQFQNNLNTLPCDPPSVMSYLDLLLSIQSTINTKHHDISGKFCDVARAQCTCIYTSHKNNCRAK